MKVKIASLFSYLPALICIVFAAMLLHANRQDSEKNGPGRSFRTGSKSERRTPVVRAIERTNPSVVSLSTRKIIEAELLSPHLLLSGSDERKGVISVGSGSIIDSCGLIATNAHVVYQSSEISVTLHNGHTYPARIIAEDIFNDIALIKINASGEKLVPIPTAKPDDLIPGETVIAVGNPFGLDGSITSGVLSGKGRSISENGKTIFSDLLQTDAAVFPGNSGGPLINLDGDMIGMNMAVRRNAPRIGFAIPLLRLENAIASFMIPERLLNLNLGILPAMDVAGTIKVADVYPDSPAEKAGVAKGMKITSFRGEKTNGSLFEFCSSLIRISAGEKLDFTFDDKKVTLVPLPIPHDDGTTAAAVKLSLGIKNMTPDLAKAMDYPVPYGVIVTEPPASSALRRGDLVLLLGNRMIRESQDIVPALRGMPSGAKVYAVVLTFAARPDGTRMPVKRCLPLTLK